jgi:aryl-alcohol dehydrogenase-like predicted oxidoreductase
LPRERIELMAIGRLELGLGLVSIGRTWGVREVPPPDEAQARDLLATALEIGIRTFDTAPAYAASEAILGRFLAGLPAPQRSELAVMTKAGEHWDAGSAGTIVDHSYDALTRSIDRSLSLLGPVAVLQIHKATEEVVADPQVLGAIDYARGAGIARFGASVGTLEAGRRAIETGAYSYLQFPLNEADRKFLALLPDMAAASVLAIINRPFAMGALVQPDPARPDGGLNAAKAAYGFVAAHVGEGIVLTGTGKPAHLRQNATNFLAAAPAPVVPGI